jgi:hypothetical protein
VTLFDATSGRALPTARDDIAVSLSGTRGVAHG